MFDPKYTISVRLLNNIKEITLLVRQLNDMMLPDVVLMEFVKRAKSLSAYASTSIEGNPLPLTEVKKILKNQPQQRRDSETEVINYNAALEWLFSQTESNFLTLSAKQILTLHQKVMAGLMPKIKLGQFRKEPVFVNDPQSGKTIYWPPDHQDVRALMNDLVNFVRNSKGKHDPLVVAGIFHKQFVIVHPFVDGNGRTTRLLTSFLLADMGLNTFSLFSFENYYNNNLSQYLRKVGCVGNYYEIVADLDFTEWLEYFTDGILDELLRVQKQIKSETLSPDQELKPHHQKLIKYIKKHGYITDAQYALLVKRAKATRILDFKKLIQQGCIERHGQGKNTYYKLKKNE